MSDQMQIKNAELSAGPDTDIGEVQVLNVLEKALKTATQAHTEFVSAGRDDMAEKEQRDIDYLLPYLPKQIGTQQYSLSAAAHLRTV